MPQLPIDIELAFTFLPLLVLAVLSILLMKTLDGALVVGGGSNGMDRVDGSAGFLRNIGRFHGQATVDFSVGPDPADVRRLARLLFIVE